jgi:hypothetical protein
MPRPRGRPPPSRMIAPRPQPRSGTTLPIQVLLETRRPADADQRSPPVARRPGRFPQPPGAGPPSPSQVRPRRGPRPPRPRPPRPRPHPVRPGPGGGHARPDGESHPRRPPRAAPPHPPRGGRQGEPVGLRRFLGAAGFLTALTETRLRLEPVGHLPEATTSSRTRSVRAPGGVFVCASRSRPRRRGNADAARPRAAEARRLARLRAAQEAWAEALDRHA